ncbi:hypothetical protein P153DRAFT_397815 [Dothidotthia symphoricarpi CBS 119687]|uniref:DUF7730 domain-containing protein n=1 Tax=Dothidotthia symphoricarpi CBS 119687 TaxID=1392245 RepID=A0A6A6AB40_9PLEO|nr:uncharacterized protein P153DRAFT_397815 [Dothidotthia symphoricarpi CBS 119687]KAF2127921.1 hypothetical protein P153DRAFT_397815 [Dothidotthia symphoricarpi CBS 119687]
MADVLPMRVMPMVSPIPKGASKSARPKRISFLDLPGELRNSIYALVVEIPDPLLIAGVERPALYRRPGDGNHALTASESQTHCTTDCYTGTGRLDPTCLLSTNHPCIDLFLSCRQIYHEVASVFFVNNTFSIIRETHFHDWRGFSFAALHSWLLQMGSQRHMLRKIGIGVETLCPESCDQEDTIAHNLDLETLTVDLWAVVGAMWSSQISAKISLQYQPPLLAGRNTGYHHLTYDRRHYDFAALERLLEAIIQEDSLHIRRYARLIRHIYVNPQGNEGVVLYVSSTKHECDDKGWDFRPSRYHACLDNRQYFSIESGSAIRIKRHHPTLLTLPGHLRNDIFGRVLYPQGITHVDVDTTGPIALVAPGLRFVNKELYESYDIGCFWWDSPLVLSTSVDCDKPSSTNFAGLRRWFSAGASQMLPYRGRITASMKSTPDIIIHLNVQVPGLWSSVKSLEANANPKWELKKLRLDIRELILVTAHLPAFMARNRTQDHQQVTIELAIWKADQKGRSQVRAKHEFSLSDLRTNVMRGIACLTAVHGLDRKAQCPQIFINGYGEAVGYSCWRSAVSAYDVPPVPFNILDTGFDWDSALEEHKRPYRLFDGSIACYADYLWRVFTGGDPDECAKMVFCLRED